MPRKTRLTTDVPQFNAQVEPLGMAIKEIPADGNCLFGAVADQLENDSTQHAKIRSEVVEHLESHPDDFMPFITTTLNGYKKYCDKMRKDGAWGGQPELAAVSQRFQVDITLHQLGLPANQMTEVSQPRQHIHLAYHKSGQEHYNSMRPLSQDMGQAEAEATLAAESTPPKAAKRAPKNAAKGKKAKAKAKPAVAESEASTKAEEEMAEENVVVEEKPAPKKRGRGRPPKAAPAEAEEEVQREVKRAKKEALKEVAFNSKPEVNDEEEKAPEKPAKKAASKKAAAQKKTAVKKTATKKVAPKKAAPKKTAVKKTAVKKACAAEQENAVGVGARRRATRARA